MKQLICLQLLVIVLFAGFNQSSSFWKGNSNSEMASANLQRGKCGLRPIHRRNIFSQHLLRGSPLNHTKPDNNNDAPDIDSRIIGGDLASPGEIPWHASISVVTRYDDDEIDARFLCGATIISEFWIVTAVHCLLSFRDSEFMITAGDHDLIKTDATEQAFLVDTIITHELYNPGRSLFDYDIALMKIKPSRNGRGIRFTGSVQPACLPDSDATFADNTMCLVSGWGRFSLDSPSFSPILKKLDVPLVNQQECRHWYATGKTQVSDLVLCAGEMRGGSGTCIGDSGGPLVCKTDHGYTLVGVVSGGKPCALPNFPGLYVRVTSFIPWINSKIRRYSGNQA